LNNRFQFLWNSVVLVILFLTVSPDLMAQDWNQWRGPNRDGSVSNSSVPATLPEKLSQKWKVVVGEGHSSPVVSGTRVYVLTRQGEQEVIGCYDLKSGKQLWKDAYTVAYRVNPAATNHGKGPKSTPLLSSGKLYTVGITGVVSCLDAGTGRVKWRKDFANRFKQTSPLYGTAVSPIIDRGLLFVHLGGHDNGALMAFDPENGAVKWSWTADGPGYSSPIIVDLGQTRHLITQSQRNVIGIAPATGELLWKIPFTTEYDQNVITPVVIGDLVIISGINKGIAAYRLARNGGKWSATQAWENKEISLYMSSPVTAGSKLFGLSHKNKGQYFCLDTSNGKVLWMSDGRQGDNAALLIAKGTILSLNTDGNLIVFPATEKMPADFKRRRVADSPTWAHPVVIGTDLLVKDATTLALWSF
jgi:outer membrane protein assembly factor BamB